MKNSVSKLPVSELQIMQILWEGHPRMSRSEIETIVNREKHLAPTTINSLLSRLENKSFVLVERRGRNNYYTPLVSKEVYQHQESQTILKQLFNNSLSNFVTALYGEEKISSEKKQELETFLQTLTVEAEMEERL